MQEHFILHNPSVLFNKNDDNAQKSMTYNLKQKEELCLFLSLFLC